MTKNLIHNFCAYVVVYGCHGNAKYKQTKNNIYFFGFQVVWMLIYSSYGQMIVMSRRGILLAAVWHQEEGNRMFLCNVMDKRVKNEYAILNSKWPPFWIILPPYWNMEADVEIILPENIEASWYTTFKDRKTQMHRVIK